ncbi:MAG: hypothetical protein DRH32_07670 [Deltaproteobacteria bacterium]|nr:MAG: hypothetical protein DRH32_07670 [Deltaproteobacteria bacterium]
MRSAGGAVVFGQYFVRMGLIYIRRSVIDRENFYMLYLIYHVFINVKKKLFFLNIINHLK